MMSRFVCDFEGCSKGYTRLEHLTRHKLNHNPVAKKGDLLRRHVPSHNSRGRARKRKIATNPTSQSVQHTVVEPTTTITRATTTSRNVQYGESMEFISKYPTEAQSNVSLESLLNWIPPYPAKTPQASSQSQSGESPIATENRTLSETSVRIGSEPMSSPGASVQPTTEVPLTPSAAIRSPPPISHEAASPRISSSFKDPEPENPPDSSTSLSTYPEPVMIPSAMMPSTPVLSTMPIFGERAVYDFSSFPFDDKFTNWLLDENSASENGSNDIFVGSSVALRNMYDDFLQDGPTKMVSVPSPPRSGEVVSPEAVERVIKLFQGCIPSIAQHPLMNCQTLSRWMHLYWKNFHPQYPILHKSTADADLLPTHLLVAIFSLGTRYDSDTNSVQLAIQLHLHLRNLVYSCPEFVPPAKLWVFQTLLLSEMFEKVVGNRHTHEMSHIFHGTLITLMRRGSSLVNPELTETQNDNIVSNAVDLQWRRWITTEGTARTAFFAFVLDIQHAELFGHTPSLYAHELYLDLPCDDGFWNAEDADTWSQLMKLSYKKMPSFFSSLKLIMSHGWNKLRLNPFGRYIVLHGLLSISWNMRQKGIITMKMGTTTPSHSAASTSIAGLRSKADSDEVTSWSHSVYKAFETWKLAFDLSEAENPSTSGIPFILASSSLHRLGIIRLYTDVLQLHAYAGVPSVLGRPIRPADYEQVQQSIKSWTKTVGSAISVWHASRLVSGAFLGQYSADSDVVLHRPWCLYVGCLVLWAYGYATTGQSTRFSEFSKRPDDGSKIWNPKDDMERYLESLLAVSDPIDIPKLESKNCTIGLMTYAGDIFKTCRWTLLGEEAAYHCYRLATAVPVRLA
ncbi:fungal-specific transcription factor domain-containing protein [Dipodascopsis tothii]|uniref:fungal-specific transcription factor domain-containing protein n=1 Tax=Dipodascopsis tothii TaxID=44089 RepID=UPI0034CDA7C0